MDLWTRAQLHQKGCQDVIHAYKPRKSAYTSTQTASKRHRALNDRSQYLVKVTCGANASVTQGGRKKATYQPQANLALHDRFGAPRGAAVTRNSHTAPHHLAAQHYLGSLKRYRATISSYHSHRLSACFVDWSMPLLRFSIARWPFACRFACPQAA